MRDSRHQMRGKHQALHLAAQNGHLSTLQALLRAGADLHALGYGGTALHFAVSGGHTAIVEYLLSTELDINAQRQDGSTALDVAAEYVRG